MASWLVEERLSENDPDDEFEDADEYFSDNDSEKDPLDDDIDEEEFLDAKTGEDSPDADPKHSTLDNLDASSSSQVPPAPAPSTLSYLQTAISQIPSIFSRFVPRPSSVVWKRIPKSCIVDSPEPSELDMDTGETSTPVVRVQS